MKPAACESVRGILSAYLDGDLAPGPAGEVRSHLERCPGCRGELESLRQTVGALRRLPDLPPPAGILAGVRAHLRPEPWYRRLLDRRQWLLGVPVGAVATLLVIVGISLFQTRLPESEKMGPPAVRETQQAAPTRTVAPTPAPSTPSTPAVPTAAPVSALREPQVPPGPKPTPRTSLIDLAKRKGLEREQPTVAPRDDELQDQVAPSASVATEVTQFQERRADENVSRPSMQTAEGWREAGTPGAREADVPAERELAASKRDLAYDDQLPIRTEEAAPPSRFVIPEPAPERAASLDKSAASGAQEKVRRLPQGRSAAIGALEATPKNVTSLRAPSRRDAPALPGRAVDERAGMRRAPPPASPPAAARRAEGEFRMAGAPPPMDRAIQPGTVSLGSAEGAPPVPAATPAAEAETVLEARRRPRPDTTRSMLLLLPADGGGINELKRLLRRGGAGEVEARVLEPREIREAFAPHHGRVVRAAPPARGWFLRAELPPRAFARLLEALANSPGLRVLEMPDQQGGGGPATAPLQLRITVLR